MGVEEASVARGRGRDSGGGQLQVRVEEQAVPTHTGPGR